MYDNKSIMIKLIAIQHKKCIFNLSKSKPMLVTIFTASKSYHLITRTININNTTNSDNDMRLILKCIYWSFK